MLDFDNFPNKQPNEQIELFLKRHWIIFFRTVLLYILMTILPIAFYFLLLYTTDIFESPVLRAVFILGGSIYSLYLVLFFFVGFLDYYLDVWIVTNKRVLNIEQKSLFSRIISEKELVKMQDITSEVIGIWATMFDYGNVYLQTAAEFTGQ